MHPSTQQEKYYLPPPSSWPLKASIAVFCLLFGTASWLHNVWFGSYLMLLGLFYLVYTVYGWFSTVIHENRTGLTQTAIMDRTFRLCMYWFIFSEIMFFGALFASLFYVRVIILPALGGETSLSHILLWPTFTSSWPLFRNPNAAIFVGPEAVTRAWGIPAFNTLVLLTSGLTITVAHFGILKNKRKQMIIFQIATIFLGLLFLTLQAIEYGEAYLEKGLTLASGIYGTTFFVLTGFHGLHVSIGAIGLCVILYRMFKNDIDAKNHFAFEAVSWYWHFVDVVWLLLFIFVYWL